MPWITDGVRLHRCDWPEYIEGINYSNGTLWGCPGCHRVYRVQITRGRGWDRANNDWGPWKSSYAWQLVTGSYYVENPVDTIKDAFSRMVPDE